MKKNRRQQKHELLVTFYGHLHTKKKRKQPAPINLKRILSVLVTSSRAF